MSAASKSDNPVEPSKPTKPSKTRRQRIVHALVRATLLYIAICGLARVLYRHVLYPAPISDPVPDPPNSLALTVQASDGAPVHALMMPREPTPGSRTIVYFHGNGEVIGFDEAMAAALVGRGFDVVLVEYRGYGRSHDAAAPTEAGLYADAEAVISELHKRGVTAKETVLWGQSLGTGVAAEMAARGHGSALVLITPFTSIPDVGARIAPWLPVHSIVTDAFDTLAKAKANRLIVPTFILHGTADHVVPFDMGVTLSKAIPNCTFVQIAGGDHNDLFATDPDGKLDPLANFARTAGR